MLFSATLFVSVRTVNELLCSTSHTLRDKVMILFGKSKCVVKSYETNSAVMAGKL